MKMKTRFARAMPAMSLVALFISACAESSIAPKPEPIEPGPQPSVWTPPADSCAAKVPDFGGVATQADLNLFAYNANFQMNLKKTVQSKTNGVETSSISFTSPGVGAVTGLLIDPVNRSGLRPGIILMHGMPGNAAQMTGLGQLFASYGAVVIAIDAPFARRSGIPAQITGQDRVEQIQLIKDLRRAVDVLRAQPNVDKERIAYYGVSYGAAMGALLVGVEHRLKAAVLQVGDGGLVSHFTDSTGGFVPGSCSVRVSWFRAMVPIEPIRFIPHATMPLLLQNGTLDGMVSKDAAEALHAAAPQPKTIQWYEAGHGLNLQADMNAHTWLHHQIGLDPVQ